VVDIDHVQTGHCDTAAYRAANADGLSMTPDGENPVAGPDQQRDSIARANRYNARAAFVSVGLRTPLFLLSSTLPGRVFSFFGGLMFSLSVRRLCAAL
jgi:hypothetical protein